ncbi:MAG: hypothetical protein ACRDRU_28905 [Pseudonocardiaceae bacterium]
MIKQAFRQFQYPTVPLTVGTDAKNRMLAAALHRAFDTDTIGGTAR